MLFWSLVIVIAAISCAVLFYAWRAQPVNASADNALRAHHRALLGEIETDRLQGRISGQEAEAARAELAREVVRQSKQADEKQRARGAMSWIAPASLVVILALSFGTYTLIGNPQLPGAPLATRTIPTSEADVADAVHRVEQQLAENPDDVQGWRVIAPVYMRMARYADAAQAYRRILELAPATADAETDLAEALMLARGGDASGEPLQLLQSAAQRDPAHVRSRFYLAGEATRVGAYEQAKQRWEELLALSQGGEPWVETARQGLAAAEQRLTGDTQPASPQFDGDQLEMIGGMVDGLASRLSDEGGTVEEWTRLVRSYLVMGNIEAAQQAYDDAKAAYPEATERGEMDALAAQNGLN